MEIGLDQHRTSIITIVHHYPLIHLKTRQKQDLRILI
jgi:hypothetical protein